MGTCGVYIIEHTASKRQYIGSSLNIEKRWRIHEGALNKGKHHSKYLQRIWSKYGKPVFSFYVVLICPRAELKIREQEYLTARRPVFNGTLSANSPVMRGGRLPSQWVENVRASIKKRYAEGFKVFHPPRSAEYKTAARIATTRFWAGQDYRVKVVAAIRAAMTPDECAARKDRTKRLWADPAYREKAVAARIGNAYNKGYKCTPAQVENRKRAARISNMKRNYGESWRDEYVRRYPEHAGDVNA